jgi:hypothetical protein
MNRARIDGFFRVLAKECPDPLRVILTGAAAGVLLGHARASMDVDFAVRSLKRDPAVWDRLRRAMVRVTEKTGLSANYAEDIDRWSQISYLDYARHGRPYKKFNALEAEVLDPAYWSIGKMARCLAPDVQDMVKVLKKQKVPLEKLVRLWARALIKSPRSNAQFQFRMNVERFLSAHGRGIWGKGFDVKKAIDLFHRSAGIKFS